MATRTALSGSMCVSLPPNSPPSTAVGGQKCRDLQALPWIQAHRFEGQVLANCAERCADAHTGGRGGNALPKWQVTHALQHRDGHDAASDAEQAREETHRRAHDSASHPRD
jgi:hypothetical protein